MHTLSLKPITDVLETLVTLPLETKASNTTSRREIVHHQEQLLPSDNPVTRSDMHLDVHKWLADMDLGFLAGPLISEGYDTMSRLAMLTMEDLLEMGIRRGYARSLLTSLKSDTNQMYKDVRIEIQNLKCAMSNVEDARKNCKDSKNRLQARRKSVRTRIMSFFQSLHEILEQRESSLLRDLDDCVNEKIESLATQQQILKQSSSEIFENFKLAKRTLSEATPTDFAKVALPMLTKLRRISSLSWMESSLRPVEDGSDISLYVSDRDDDSSPSSSEDKDIPFIVRELKRTGRVLNLSSQCSYVKDSDMEKDLTSSIVVTAGIPHQLVLTARDRTRTQVPLGGAIVVVQIFKNTCEIESTNQQQLTAVEHVHRIVDRDNGIYDIEFTLPSGSRGDFTVFVSINGGNVEGSPLKVKCDSNVCTRRYVFLS